MITTEPVEHRKRAYENDSIDILIDQAYRILDTPGLSDDNNLINDLRWRIQKTVFQLSGELSDKEGWLTEKYTSTMRELVIGLIEKLHNDNHNACFNDLEGLDYTRLGNFKRLFASGSPSLISESANGAEKLSLIGYLQNSPLFYEEYRNLIGEFVYDFTSTSLDQSLGAKRIQEMLESLDSSLQLRAIMSFKDLAQTAEAEGFDVIRFCEILKNSLNQLNNTNALTAILISQYQGVLEDIISRCMGTGAFINDSWRAELEKRNTLDSTRKVIDRDRQLKQKLKISNPNLGDPTSLAPGLIGVRGAYGSIVGVALSDDRELTALSDEEKLELNVEDIREYMVRELGIEPDYHKIESLTLLHRPEMRGLLEWYLGDISQYSLELQLQLLDFLFNSSPNRYFKFTDVLRSKKLDKNLFLEAFLATEYGDQLGDSILQIAEKSNSYEISREIFGLISSIRENVRVWEANAWFAQQDSGYSGYFEGIRQAIEARLSQILSPIPDLMDGKTQQAHYFHRDHTPSGTFDISSIDQVLQGLKVLDLMLQKIAQAENEPINDRKAMIGDDFLSSATMIDGSNVRIMMRAYEAHQAEARIRWAVTITPEEQLEIFGCHLDVNAKGQTRNARASLRLDLEKITGGISLDFGSSMDFGSKNREYIDRLLAALITVGVQHDAKRRGADIRHKDYHVRGPFAGELAEPEKFGSFVEKMQKHYIDATALDLGNLGVHASGIATETTNEAIRSNIIYTGIFFGHGEIQRIADVVFANQYANKPDNPHVTIQFRPKDGLQGIEVGEIKTVKIVGYVDDGKAQVLIVSPDSVESIARPHITIATSNDINGKKIPPSYAKHMIKQAEKDGSIVWFEKPKVLKGVFGFFDGQTREAITQAV